MSQLQSPGDQRPDFMVFLGLLPPYSLDDVHKAYKARASAAHPDRGGSTADFVRLQETYEQAQEYVKFQEGRRGWLAAQVEPYLRQQELIAEIERRGGKVDIESLDWMERSFGDFAALADRLRQIILRDCPDGDAFLKYLSDNSKELRYLNELDLSGSTVTDAGLLSLAELRSLERIDLSKTRVTASGLEELAKLPQIEWINVWETSVGWWARWQYGRRHPQAKVLALPPV